MNNLKDDRILFLKKLNLKKYTVMIFRILIIFIFFLIWELSSKYKIIDSFLFSSPINILKTILNLYINNNLLNHIFVTISEVFLSFFISSFIGILIPVFLWKFNFIAEILDPYFTILNSLPKVSLGPLIIIWIGASTNSIIIMALLISCFITIISVYNNFKNTNNDYLILLKSYGANNWQIIYHLLFPCNFTNIINSLKVNISMCLIGVIMGELLVSKKGIGYLIIYGSQIFNIDLIITCIFILGFISYIFYFFICKFEDFFKKK